MGLVPVVGSVLHYHVDRFPAGIPRAAIVTEVDDPLSADTTVSLAVMDPPGISFVSQVPHATENPAPAGTWSWPPAPVEV